MTRALFALASLSACAAAPTVAEPAPVVVSLDAITAPASTGTVAERVTVAVDVPPVLREAAFDCASYVNGLAYGEGNPEPAREGYRVTASCRGWSQDTIAKWEHFIVDDVWMGEASECPLVIGGALFAGHGNCDLAVQGRREDAGIGQLIALWYQPGGPLCVAEGLCSKYDIVASPWASLSAALFAVEYDGSRPWCYDARARRLHWSCDTVSRYWP